jgi:hypothetical protein
MWPVAAVISTSLTRSSVGGVELVRRPLVGKPGISSSFLPRLGNMHRSGSLPEKQVRADRGAKFATNVAQITCELGHEGVANAFITEVQSGLAMNAVAT